MQVVQTWDMSNTLYHRKYIKMVSRYLAKILETLKSVILTTQKGRKKFNPEKILLQLLLSDLHSITTKVWGD